MDFDGLQKVQEEHKAGLTKSQDQAKSILKQKTEYETLLQKLETITDKTSYNVMVPLGGSKAFFEAQVEHTNEIMVLLGDNWFAERSAKEAREICQRRIDKCQSMLDGLDKESKLYQSWLQEASKIDTEIREDGTKDIVEDYDEEKEKQWRIEHQARVKAEKNLASERTADAGDDDDFWRRLDELELEEELEQHEALLKQKQECKMKDSESEDEDRDWSDSPSITDDDEDSAEDSKHSEDDTDDGPKRSVSFGNVSERLFSREQDNGNLSDEPSVSALSGRPEISTKVVHIQHTHSSPSFLALAKTTEGDRKFPRHPGELVELFHSGPPQLKVEPPKVSTPKKSILKKSKYDLKVSNINNDSDGRGAVETQKKMNFATTPQTAVSDIVIERNPENKLSTPIAQKEAKPKTQIISRFRATRINQ